MGVGQAKETIADVNRMFIDAFTRRDAAAVASLYATGAHLLPPHSDILIGTDAIRAFWQSIMDMGLGASIETVDLEEAGDRAIEIGRYMLTLADGSLFDRGKYLVVWKQEGGEWRLSCDMWNTSQPPAQS